jgi:hypothetical protein
MMRNELTHAAAHVWMLHPVEFIATEADRKQACRHPAK